MGGMRGRFIVALISCLWHAWCKHCVHGQNKKQQNPQRKRECEKCHNKMRRGCLSPITLKTIIKKSKAKGEGADVWRWLQWCHLLMPLFIPELNTHSPCLSCVMAVISHLSVTQWPLQSDCYRQQAFTLKVFKRM